ncbi:MAG: pilin [Candidatus Shapirobacteria bacterium]|jgi:hypothetical protein
MNLSQLSLVVPAYAQQQIKLQPKAGGGWDSLTGLTAGGIISGAISLIMLVVALVFFFMLVWGGLRWVMSQGDSKNVEGARNQITNALIGLAIVFAAWAIMKLIGTVFGIDILGTLTVPTFQP